MLYKKAISHFNLPPIQYIYTHSKLSEIYKTILFTILLLDTGCMSSNLTKIHPKLAGSYWVQNGIGNQGCKRHSG